MLDHNGILARLDRLDEYVKILKEVQRASETAFLADYHVYGLAERYMHLSIECLLDVGQMLISGLGLRRPEHYREVVEVLQEAGVISPELAARLAGIAGFRNILVHDYLEIDRQLVYRHLQEDLADFELFAREIVTFLRQHSSFDKN